MIKKNRSVENRTFGPELELIRINYYLQNVMTQKHIHKRTDTQTKEHILSDVGKTFPGGCPSMIF